MSNIFGLMYSFILILPTILFGVDLMRISTIRTFLEARATVASYQISKEGGIKQSLINSLEAEGVTIECSGECTYISMGETISFRLVRMYTPMILRKEEMEVKVTRVVIVGYL